MKKVDETNKTFRVAEEENETKTPVSGGKASEKKHEIDLRWWPVLALIISVAAILIIF